MDVRDALATIGDRRHLLGGVVVTGGEPTVHPALPSLLAELQAMGLAVKLDTNGSNPAMLERILRGDGKGGEGTSGPPRPLADYVALDVKADPGAYPERIAPAGPRLGDAVLRSVRLLVGCGVPHEFRIPCVAPFIDGDVFRRILDAVLGGTADGVAGADGSGFAREPPPPCGPVHLQAVRTERVLDAAFFEKREGRPLTREEMEELRGLAQSVGIDCTIR
jgi:pyruvate formate lyase activating enzyme